MIETFKEIIVRCIHSLLPVAFMLYIGKTHIHKKEIRNLELIPTIFMGEMFISRGFDTSSLTS